jgi:hypothetical protein
MSSLVSGYNILSATDQWKRLTEAVMKEKGALFNVGSDKCSLFQEAVYT